VAPTTPSPTSSPTQYILEEVVASYLHFLTQLCESCSSPCCECEKDGVSDVNLVTIRIVNVNTVLRVAAWSAPKKRMWMETTIVKFATRRLVIHARWQNAKVKITTAESV
jgi:hypothetical protein